MIDYHMIDYHMIDYHMIDYHMIDYLLYAYSAGLNPGPGAGEIIDITRCGSTVNT